MGANRDAVVPTPSGRPRVVGRNRSASSTRSNTSELDLTAKTVPDDRRIVSPMDPEQLPLGLLLSLLLRHWYAQIEGRRSDEYADLTHTQAAVFENISPQGSRVSEMAERALVTKQAISEIVDYLERQGYVERTPDPTDGRAKMVRLAKRGRRAALVTKLQMIDLEHEWAIGIGDGNMAALRQTLLELLRSFSEESDEDAAGRPTPGRNSRSDQ